jgi:hypothetical protein
VIRGRIASAPAAAALIVYVVAALVLFGRPLLHSGSHECVCIGSSTDPGAQMWLFAWWPHALLHGLNPMFPRIVYAPVGINLGHAGLGPAAPLILTPVTEIAGPLFSYNLAMALSPALAAFFAFLLCRRITAAFWPALVGGWLFGFSTYMLGQLVGHLNLVLVFLVPAIVHLALRALDGELSQRRFTVLLVIALVLQFYLAVEVFASMTLFGAVALGLSYALSDERHRARLREMSRPIALSYVATALLASPYLYYALQHGATPSLPARSDVFSNDVAAFVVPTQITAIGGLTFLSTSLKFTAGYVEGGAYLGMPLILMTLLGVRAGFRRRGVKIALFTLVVILVCSLGGHLHVGGDASIPLPWALAERLPALGVMLPARFILYGVLICAVLAAMWLATIRPNAVSVRAASVVLAALAVASLWPALGRHYWRSRPDVPKLFAASAYKQAIGAHDIALVLPVGIAGQSMLWQAEAKLGFRMASGYVLAPEAADPYKRYAIYPTLTTGAPVPNESAAAAEFLGANRITVAILEASAAANSPWVPILEHLGWGPTTRDGVVLLRYDGFVPEPSQPTPSPRTPHASGPPAARRSARAVTRAYLRALQTGDTGRVCTLLTPQAMAAQLQSRSIDRQRCPEALRPILARAGAIRALLSTAAVGPATIKGLHGYVEFTVRRGQQIQYLPVRRLGGKWLVNGVAVAAS